MSLLPLAEAQAVPAERGGSGGASELSWSVEWAEAVRGLLAGFWAKDASETSRAVVEVDPPDGRGDGTGIDPHGGPRPRQSQRPNK